MYKIVKQYLNIRSIGLSAIGMGIYYDYKRFVFDLENNNYSSYNPMMVKYHKLVYDNLIKLHKNNIILNGLCCKNDKCINYFLADYPITEADVINIISGYKTLYKDRNELFRTIYNTNTNYNTTFDIKNPVINIMLNTSNQYFYNYYSLLYLIENMYNNKSINKKDWEMYTKQLINKFGNEYKKYNIDVLLQKKYSQLNAYK